MGEALNTAEHQDRLNAAKLGVKDARLTRDELVLSASEMGRQLVNNANDELKAAVKDARAAGLSWSQISQGLGTSRQSAQMTFGD